MKKRLPKILGVAVPLGIALSFTLAALPPAPTPQIPPATTIPPTWIYAIVGVGVALIAVVIVLIVRSRRPPT